MLGAIELVADKSTKARFDPSLKVPNRLFEGGWGNRVIFRAFSENIIGLAPALCCGENEMSMIFERIRRTLDDLLAMPDIKQAIS
jgi:adenosylmethionine-8-amino-7-oxononanoate aminotransferase